ncbi:uncharacterized protein [Miscanthus floridulus]|uniref:uncharacterized protein n=1 Tax=Miscanthus floridulus TaxID=154761 RepID=UPI003458D69B
MEDGFVSEVEEVAIGLVGKIFEREYMSRMAVAGTMPRLNRVFEEVGIIYREREVPTEVLASIEKKKKKAYAKNVTAEAESKKRKGAVGSRAPMKKKKKSGAPLIALALSSTGSVGAASAGSEDVESSSAPSTDARVASGGDRGSPIAPVCPTSGAMSGAGRPETGVVPMRSSHGATSIDEQPDDSAVEPMPDVLGGLCSSFEEDTEAIPRHVPSSPATATPLPVPVADVGRLEPTLAEEAPAARPSLSPLPAGPLAEEVRPFGPSPHDTAETSAQRARQAALPRLFMSDVMAGLLTPEE